MMRKFIQIALVLAAAVAAGCGGGSKTDAFGTTGSSSGSGTGTGGGTVTVASVTLTTDAQSIPTDGSKSANITALVRDSANNLLPNVSVTVTADSGGIAGSPAKTDTSGAAKVVLSTAGDPTVRTIHVTASAGGVTSQPLSIGVSAGTGTVSVQMGSGTGAGFSAGTLAISTANLSAGGSTSVNTTLQQSDGTLYTQSASITFSSPCQAQGLATITSPVVTTTGIASTTYAAKGCSGPDVITATTTVGSNSLSATGTVTVASAAVGSIVFVSATPTNVGIKGTGAAGRQETSTVVFQVLDTSGGPRAGATVNFSLDTTVGGITLAPASGITDANGKVQTVVQAGTVATSVRVTATVQGVTPVIATQSSQLTITTGIPTQNAFSIAVSPCPNLEAANIDGVNAKVTVRMADRFSNPVPDGTAVTFSTQGGKIDGQCTTATTPTESGVCTVNWTSQDPRPANLRSSLLATAIGEESFIDANGNGVFDTGETFFDRAERFRDDADKTNDSFDTDANYQVGDVYYDFNNNQTRDAADGIFNGVLCNAGALCDANKKTTGIGKRSLIIFSTGGAKISDPGTQTVAKQATIQVTFIISDLNNNPIPYDAQVTAVAVGSAASVSGGPFTQGCFIGRSGYPFTFNVTGSATGTGGITVTVKSATGVLSTRTVSIIVP